jgi:hypothetical protein
MNTYLAAYLCFFVLFAGHSAGKNISAMPTFGKRSAATIVIVLVIFATILAMTPRGIWNNFDKNLFYAAYDVYRAPAEKLAERIQQSVDPAKDKVYVISTGETPREFYMLRYLIMPTRTNGNQTLSLSTKELPDASYTVNVLSPEQFSEVLISNSYTHVFILYIDETFTGQYGELFQNRADISGGNLFRIEIKTDGGVELIREY